MAASPTMKTAAPLIPANPTLAALREAAARCRACPLWKCGTQTVFGEGAGNAKVVLVGEVPGDREDREGKPFVGPAGKLLDEVLEEAGIDRRVSYVTNAVKHFKWEPAGKRRLHKKPGTREIAACRPWLEAELVVLQPELVIALGATAAQTLMGRDFRVTRDHGRLLDSGRSGKFLATAHPSSILRAPENRRRTARAQLVEDLKIAAAWLRAKT